MKIAQIGEEDSYYKYIKSFIRNKLPIDTVEKESNLKVIQGDYSTLSLFEISEAEVVMKNAT